MKQINYVLCYFGKLDSIIKLQLMYYYCSSMYGSELWDFTCDRIAYLCVSWRRDLKNIWKLLINTHANILFGLYSKRPIEVELRYVTLSFMGV